MYESPITQFVDKALNQIIKTEEDNLVYEIQQAIGYEINKEELIKALKYDRDQYQKGYKDGRKDNEWIPVSERLPKCCGVYEVTMRCDDGLYGSACYFDGQDTWHNDNRINFARPFVNDKVIAWKPKYELYKGVSE